MENVRYRVLISGRVHGVNFRWSTQRKAESLGVTGFVRNLGDGRVEAVFEGERAAVEEMIRWARHGPPSAEVTGVQATPEAYTGAYHDFSIRSSIW